MRTALALVGIVTIALFGMQQAKAHPWGVDAEMVGPPISVITSPPYRDDWSGWGRHRINPLNPDPGFGLTLLLVKFKNRSLFMSHRVVLDPDRTHLWCNHHFGWSVVVGDTQPRERYNKPTLANRQAFVLQPRETRIVAVWFDGSYPAGAPVNLRIQESDPGYIGNFIWSDFKPVQGFGLKAADDDRRKQKRK